MPTYSYRCRECGDAFDVQQSFTDPSLTVCPACGGELRKVFSPVGVSFTGSGFYRNDSRAKPAGGSEGSSSDSSSSATDAGSGSSEKPAPAAKEKSAAKASAKAASGTGTGSKSSTSTSS